MNKRIDSIDVIRGIAMVVMALDHVRDWTHAPSIAWGDPTNLATTTPWLFFTRWITHFCAPTFVFLAGTSIFLSLQRRGNTKEQRTFIFKRGLWLILLEVFVVSLGWHFDLRFPWIGLQVIWAIGVSMLVLAVTSRWSAKINLIIGGSILLFHNAFDWLVVPGTSPIELFWQILHQFTILRVSEHFQIFFVYPVLPWIGTMMVGFAFGSMLSDKATRRQGDKATRRQGDKATWKRVVFMGIVLCSAFCVLRLFNIYGDPRPWSLQKDYMFNVLAFLNCAKYPPSLLYLCMTLGPMLVLLGLLMRLESLKTLNNWHSQILKFSNWIKVFGRVPLFYYILHIYIGHAIGWAMAIAQGYSLSAFWDARTFGGNPLGSGFDLWVSYVVWIILVVGLYPLCVWYDKYKTRNPNKMLLRYL